MGKAAGAAAGRWHAVPCCSPPSQGGRLTWASGHRATLSLIYSRSNQVPLGTMPAPHPAGSATGAGDQLAAGDRAQLSAQAALVEGAGEEPASSSAGAEALAREVARGGGSGELPPLHHLELEVRG